MIFADYDLPVSFEAQQLDEYLVRGWFRMQQSLFTTHFLCFKSRFYSAVWLRIGLANYKADNKQKEIFKRNRHFSTVIVPFEITPALEELYELYREAMSFVISPTLTDLLLGASEETIFNTQCVQIYDGERLIAAGIFDKGENTAAGISCFYHPAYKKYSLGKHLMYLKIGACIKEGKSYFYPGYTVPGYPAFDYKLQVGTQSLEYLSLLDGHWHTMESFANANPLSIMLRQLALLQEVLSANSISSGMHYYRFFDANLEPLYTGMNLFDFPVFLQMQPVESAQQPTVWVYDVSKASFVLMSCLSIFKLSDYSADETIYAASLLQVMGRLWQVKELEEVDAALKSAIQKSEK